MGNLKDKGISCVLFHICQIKLILSQLGNLYVSAIIIEQLQLYREAKNYIYHTKSEDAETSTKDITVACPK